jgi:hypothetical protein
LQTPIHNPFFVLPTTPSHLGKNQASLSALALSMAVLTNLTTANSGQYQQMMVDNNK